MKRWRKKKFLIVSDDLTTRCSVRFLTTLMVWRKERERIKRERELNKKKRCLQYIKIVCFQATTCTFKLITWMNIEYLIDDPEAVIFYMYNKYSNSTLLNLENKNQKNQNRTKINKLNYILTLRIPYSNSSYLLSFINKKKKNLLFLSIL